MDDFSGKTIIVTGAATGLGRQTALRFARAGANVVVADIDAVLGSRLPDTLAAEGANAVFVRADVSREADVEAMVATALDRFGSLDCAFNNAGIAPPGMPLTERTEEQWDRTIAVNLKGVWLCLKHECRAMLQSGSGAIVNTASVMGVVSGPGLDAYSASKAGVIGLTKAAAMDFAAQGIRINAVCPGGIAQTAITDAPANAAAMEQLRQMTPMQRLGEPDDIADIVLWLCSGGAKYMTGQALTINGGFSVW